MRPPRKIRNIGVLAHVDAGKTTLTEHILFLSGSTRSMGRVDKGTSLSDGLDVERRRGISVRASTLSVSWRDVQINLIDTPGHMDFAAEVERSLRVLDCAVLVICAVEGIQSHTELIWDALSEMSIPVILYINKIDRVGSDFDALADEIKESLSRDLLLLNRPRNEGDDRATIQDLTAGTDNDFMETVASEDENLMEVYLSDTPPTDESVAAVVARSVKGRRLFPVMCGSAKNEVGTKELLEAVTRFFPDAEGPMDSPVSGLVFKIDTDSKLGRIAGIRLFAGTLRNRDTVFNHTADREEKITQIKKSYLNAYGDTGLLEAGDIGFLCGLPEARIGDIIGDPDPVPGRYVLSEPILSARVYPTDQSQWTDLGNALTVLSSEDPHLDFTWLNDEREMTVRIMGRIQMEIVEELLSTRFGIQAKLSDPTVIYRETPVAVGRGEESYTMPKPCWAIVSLELIPAARGSGVSFRSEVSVDKIKQRYQNEMAANLYDAFKQGILGWEVTDLEVVLRDGSDHVLHSRPGNFKLAMNIAVLRGLTASGSHLLEPILSFKISAPEKFLGKISSEVIEMRGSFEPPVIKAGHCLLAGKVPLSTSMDYAIRLGSLTSGRAKLTVQFSGYEICPGNEGVSRPYKGISPLDRSKYILKMRGAITEV